MSTFQLHLTHPAADVWAGLPDVFPAMQGLTLPPLEGPLPVTPAVGRVPTLGAWHLEEAGAWLTGCCRVEVSGDYAELTRQLYQSLFAATVGWNLARVWNCVPAINQQADGLENYRAFCLGRAEAFAGHFAQTAEAQMPAATGIGASDRYLDLSFIATRGPLRHLENPEQVPAYRYPRDYGPRSPSFSRATYCPTPDGGIGFVSGTAAIKGHRSCCQSLEEECATTVHNLQLIGARLEGEGISPTARRAINLFIRHAEDAAFIQDYLARHWLRPGDLVQAYRADICRAELNLEIEYLTW